MAKPIFLVLLVAGLIVRVSVACDCASPRNAKEAFAKANAVFLGELVGEGKGTGGLQYSLAYFKVERSWKKITGIRAQVKVGHPRACGYPFKVGRKYLVFVHDDAPSYTSICSGTKVADEAEEEIKSLGPSIALK